MLIMYNAYLKFYDSILLVCSDEKYILELICSEYNDFIVDGNVEKSDLTLYFNRYSAPLSIEKEWVYIQDENGLIGINKNSPISSFCLYTTADASLFRIAVIKTIAAYMLYSNIPVMHCSMINMNGFGLGFLGNSGSGKSALAGGMILSYGAKLVGDDAFLLVQEKDSLKGYSISALTGIDFNAISKLLNMSSIQYEPTYDSVLFQRKRIYCNISKYKKDSFCQSATLNVIFQIIPEYGSFPWIKKIDGENKKYLMDANTLYFVPDIPSPSAIKYLHQRLSEIPIYALGLSKEYKYNLEFINNFIIDNRSL